jgi:EAL domain-containing protein (putative c-di-GMP-specific phosphodiesterase class I)
MDVMVDLSARLGMQVIADGLEESAHLSLVIRAGADLAQGRLLAGPDPAEHVEAYLDRYRAPSV